MNIVCTRPKKRTATSFRKILTGRVHRPASADEVYPSLSILGKTCSNARIIKTNAIELWFRFDGGLLKACRENLPEPLASKFPYDPAAAKAAAQAEAARADRERDRKAQIRPVLPAGVTLENSTNPPVYVTFLTNSALRFPMRQYQRAPVKPPSQ